MKKILLAILVMIFVTPVAIAATKCDCTRSKDETIFACASLECAQQEQKKSGKVHITGTIHPAEPSLRTTTFMFPVRITYEHDGKEEYLNHASPYFGLNLDENATGTIVFTARTTDYKQDNPDYLPTKTSVKELMKDPNTGKDIYIKKKTQQTESNTTKANENQGAAVTNTGKATGTAPAGSGKAADAATKGGSNADKASGSANADPGSTVSPTTTIQSQTGDTIADFTSSVFWLRQTDTKYVPLPNVQITDLNTGKKTTTDQNGKFTIQCLFTKKLNSDTVKNNINAISDLSAEQKENRIKKLSNQTKPNNQCLLLFVKKDHEPFTMSVLQSGSGVENIVYENYTAKGTRKSAVQPPISNENTITISGVVKDSNGNEVGGVLVKPEGIAESELQTNPQNGLTNAYISEEETGYFIITGFPKGKNVEATIDWYGIKDKKVVSSGIGENMTITLNKVINDTIEGEPFTQQLGEKNCTNEQLQTKTTHATEGLWRIEYDYTKFVQQNGSDVYEIKNQYCEITKCSNGYEPSSDKKSCTQCPCGTTWRAEPDKTGKQCVTWTTNPACDGKNPADKNAKETKKACTTGEMPKEYCEIITCNNGYVIDGTGKDNKCVSCTEKIPHSKPNGVNSDGKKTCNVTECEYGWNPNDDKDKCDFDCNNDAVLGVLNATSAEPKKAINSQPEKFTDISNACVPISCKEPEYDISGDGDERVCKINSGAPCTFENKPNHAKSEQGTKDANGICVPACWDNYEPKLSDDKTKYECKFTDTTCPERLQSSKEPNAKGWQVEENDDYWDENGNLTSCKLSACIHPALKPQDNVCKVDCMHESILKRLNATKAEHKTTGVKYPLSDDSNYEDACYPTECDPAVSKKIGEGESARCKTQSEFDKECNKEAQERNAQEIHYDFATGKCVIDLCNPGYGNPTNNKPQDGECKSAKGEQCITNDDELKRKFPNAASATWQDPYNNGNLVCLIEKCVDDTADKHYVLRNDHRACTEGISEQKMNDLKDAAEQARNNENSLINKTIGAVGIGGAGVGGMMVGSALAERAADADAEDAMQAYLNTFKCDYGNGTRVNGGETNVELPTADLVELRTKYAQDAYNLKQTKEKLGLRSGIESEIPIATDQFGPYIDVDTTTLYDDVGTGITGHTDTMPSIARALQNPDGVDAAQWNEQKKTTQSELTTGAVTAGAAIATSAAANIGANYVPKDAKTQTLFDAQNLKQLGNAVKNLTGAAATVAK